jgi:two-component system C4-dicarboxylate transport sensor histidine kinase DctB
VTGPTGLTIASSNWRQADSFVGSNYAFREYFQAAMKTGMSEHYALGNVSRRPGLYISRRIDAADGRPLGVVIAKVEFNRLEADWNIGGKPVYVVDRNGVVLMTSVPEWRFKTVAAIDEARRNTISESLQFGNEALATLPFRTARSLATVFRSSTSTSRGANAAIIFAWKCPCRRHPGPCIIFSPSHPL